jgi:hypothetical protein
MKSQTVRALDVVLFGPVLIALATRRCLTPRERVLLGLIGFGTIFYNLGNYLLTHKLQENEKQI